MASTETLRASPRITSEREFTDQICGSAACKKTAKVKVKRNVRKDFFMRIDLIKMAISNSG